MDHPLYEQVIFTRRLDRDDAIWYDVKGNNQNPIVVTELYPEQGYQYKVKAVCAVEESDYTRVDTFITLPKPAPKYVCGAEDTTPKFTNKVPLTKPLQPGDIVMLPQNVELVIKEVSGNNPYRGWGEMFFNFVNANLIVTFEDLEVNELYQWLDGDVVSKKASSSKFLINTDAPTPAQDTIKIDINITDDTKIIIKDSTGNPVEGTPVLPLTLHIENENSENGEPENEEPIKIIELPAVIITGDRIITVAEDGSVKIEQAKTENGKTEEKIDTIRNNTIKPEHGDPLVDMKIVHTNTAPNSGGMFGCARIGSDNCSRLSNSIPNLPKYDDKKKVHDGIDLYASVETNVYSMYDGEIVFIEKGVSPNTEGEKDYGNYVVIKYTSQQHGNKGTQKTIYALYAHLNSVDNDIKVNSKVLAGQIIGKSGCTGNANNLFNKDTWRQHLHLTIYENSWANDNRVDPRIYITTKFDNNGNKND